MTNVEHIDGLKAILRGMSNHKPWGGCHTEEKTALRCLKHVNIPKSLVKKFINKTEFFIVAKKTGDIHLSLNTSNKEMIKSFLSSDYETCQKIQSFCN